MLNLLIADDDTDVCNFIAAELRDAGFNVTTVDNGADAVMKAIDGNFNLVLLDMMMPNLHGIKTIQLLQKTLPQLPIIGLTGFVGRGYMEKAAVYGVKCFSKPVEIPFLIGEIKQVLKK